MNNKDFQIEEYKFLCQEKHRYFRERDYTTIISLTVGLPLIGFGIKEGKQNSDPLMIALFFVIPLVIFLYLFVRFHWTDLLGLKADSYIRFKLEKEIDQLNWFTKKKDYDLGILGKLHEYSWMIAFISLIGLDLILIFSLKEYWIFGISTGMSLIMIILTLYWRYRMNDTKMEEHWIKRFGENN